MSQRKFESNPGRRKPLFLDRLWRIGPPRRASVVVFTCLLLLGTSIYTVDTQIRPSIKSGAHAIAVRAANVAISRAVTEEIASDPAVPKIVHVDVNHDGDLKVANFDFTYVTQVQSRSTELAENYLGELSQDSLRLPIAQALGGSILSSLGPSVPVKVYLVGSAHSSVTMETHTVGINQTVHVLYLHLEAEEQVVAPLVTEPITVQTQIPLAYLVLDGKVPNTYFSGAVPGWIPGAVQSSAPTGMR